MKGQGTPSDAHFDYIQLSDLSQEVRPRSTGVLGTLTALGISSEALGLGGIEQPLQVLLAKELSCSRHFRWAALDNLAEKILQGLLLNKQDISQEAISFCAGMIRQVPSGRSFLLHQANGLKKMYAARGLVLTTEMALTKAIKISIAAFLSYRLYASFQMEDNSNFLELTSIFADNSKKGLKSLVYLLAKVPSEWLYLLLTSPAIAGVLKGLWDTQKSEPLTENAITQLQEAVDHHTNALLTKSYLWGDILRQMIPMPGFSSVSERVQRAEQQIRWDGRVTNEERVSLFSNIERLALHGSGMSKINAMQSLAKIVHSLSIKDFHRLQDAGYSPETLTQILRIKKQAFHGLKTLSTRASLQPMQEGEQATTAALQKSLVSTVYAAYLLWWLGMGEFKYSPLFLSFKLGKLALEGLFLKAVVESILEAIKCPDKKYFNLRSGGFDVRANDLTPDCFKEFVRQFRFLSQEESFAPFLEQLNNFDFTEVGFIDLSGKALTSNETIKILNVLKNKSAPIKVLNLASNKINETMALSFPNSLQSLDLSFNKISAEGAKGLQLPPSLQSLNLMYNSIGAEGAKGLQLPPSLQSLILNANSIGDEGAKGLQLPPSLQSLSLWSNSIGDEGAKGLQFPPSLQSLSLWINSIGAEGAKGLQLPPSLQSLELWGNRIGTEGAKGLQLPPSLQSLNLWGNNIGDEGAKGLQLPSSLQSLHLSNNNISDAGARGLQLLPLSSLTSLDLSSNSIGAEGIKGLQLYPSLQSLDLSDNSLGTEGAKGLPLSALSKLQSLNLGNNNIGDEGVKGLQFPPSLQSLGLWGNNIGAEGAKRLQLPPSLQSLNLIDNSIGDEGAKGLPLLPLSSLQSLDLSWNNIGDEGVKGLQLPPSLKSLNLMNNNITDEGAKGLPLPSTLQSLDLSSNNIGDEGAKGLQLPVSLQYLYLSSNGIGTEGVNALLQKIPRTNLTTIALDNNPYNSTANNLERTIQQKRQQQALLKNCQNQLCYADTSLSQDAYQTSSATRAQPPLFFSWLKKPFDKLAEYASVCMSTTLGSLGTRLEKVLSQSPSYFPNIRSPEINDWQPSGSVMLHQFKAGGSNVLLLSATTQTSIQPSLRSIGR